MKQQQIILPNKAQQLGEKTQTYFIDNKQVASSEILKEIAKQTSSQYLALITKLPKVEISEDALQRFAQVANDTKAGMLYADYYKVSAEKRELIPTIEYQEGSLRDDFDFGNVLFFDANLFKQIVENQQNNYKFAALYDLRLKIPKIFHINEPLYDVLSCHCGLDPQSLEKQPIAASAAMTNNQQFAYVDVKNISVQQEMEKAVTKHLKNIGALLTPETLCHCVFDTQSPDDFEFEASIIIPVKNREKTIFDAIKSAYSQKTNFKFNIIVVDNHSTDKTTEIIKAGHFDQREKSPANNNRFLPSVEMTAPIVHITPTRRDLNIGGCWNEAVNHPKCGKFAVQLDSDDVYINENVLQKIVDEFYSQCCAMLIGSYTLVNFDYEKIPPGDITHAEWTEQNGMNNALRINGLGAPRCFYTPIIRKIGFPNVSYGEDYAVGLRICRDYKIGRIYDSLYLCRRWDSNSDANIDIKKLNEFNLYKDKIRTIELLARKK